MAGVSGHAAVVAINAYRREAHLDFSLRAKLGLPRIVTYAVVAMSTSQDR
jgi:hypothetical protein